MKLADYYRDGRRGLSFELFPPKTEAGLQSLYEHVDRLMAFKPDYFTCTYGAGGSTQGLTLDVLSEVRRRTELPVASHLTCVGATADEIRTYLQEASQRGTDFIVALRGDPPKGETTFQAVAGGLRYANELVELIRTQPHPFGIAVAGYPEVHQEALDADSDLSNLKRKVDAGADIVITQLFYDNADFYRFRERCEQNGITVPIVPGLLPITNLAQAQRITSMCKAKLPPQLVQRLSEKEAPDWQFEIGVQHAREQLLDLLKNDAAGMHLYVLNKSQAAEKMLEGCQLGSTA
ncbi:methylenetetrahydrofolate reductase [NAD(P)H] [Roseimaritima ulvae]|uniref:Methylenetetrahydrofolate reductase n=1 Tax=Roseimaritima ulvae TaxID=980254 RepID=A0A5B9QNI6_9BACT|nr:methylenetetrahydrofolate reductase [NAD(P)H] [Roseimaritima ulvae]QEG39462.1 5,10-methylenetetrahydrofolate reductase [Roseimaritima ulvae]